jgi:NAD+ synthase (glutamine-hydrolysing)
MLRYGFTPTKIYTLACRAFESDFDAATVKKWLVTFYRRFFSQQFKRNCLPDGVRIGSVGLGPRGDWAMPSDACADIWLAEAEAL